MADKLKSIMALVRKYVAASLSAGGTESPSSIAAALESAIREAIAAPGVAQGWVMVPEGATKEMIAAAWNVDWSNEDVEGTVHNIWNGMLAAAPSPTTEQHIQLHDPVTIKGGPAE